jgi:predicted DNA-binding transcriptional regulator AlpA
MSEDQTSPFLNVEEAAAYLRLKKRTLDNMRWQGIGPRFRKHGGRILYHRDDIVEWSQSRSRRSTSGLDE